MKDVIIQIDQLENLPISKSSKRKMPSSNINKQEDSVDAIIHRLQTSYIELCEEKDEIINKLDDIVAKYATEVEKLRDRCVGAEEKCKELSGHNIKLRNELNVVQQELADVQYNHEVLQVDYHAECTTNKELRSNIRDLNKRIRGLQEDITDADTVTTKRLGRIISRCEQLEVDNDELISKIDMYETDLSSINLLCFVCRAGVETQSCSKCQHKICKSCYDTLKICPFCRKDLEKIEEDLT